MKLTVREMTSDDAELIVDYFVNLETAFLYGMGAEKSKLPKRLDWINKLKTDLNTPIENKAFYYIVWLIDGCPVGHSNINQIEYGRSARMHLHLWHNENREKGLGYKFLVPSIALYFKKFKLETLVCEPYAKNPAPNKVLLKLGFQLISTYKTTPGVINFHQLVNRFELTKANFIASNPHLF